MLRVFIFSEVKRFHGKTYDQSQRLTQRKRRCRSDRKRETKEGQKSRRSRRRAEEKTCQESSQGSSPESVLGRFQSIDEARRTLRIFRTQESRQEGRRAFRKSKNSPLRATC